MTIEQLAILLATVLIIFYLTNKLAKTSKFQILGELITDVKTQEKVVALTYDDGPNPPYTNKLLDTLERLQVKVTFFVLGKNLEKYPQIAQEIFLKGHELGNHSYSHLPLIWKKASFIKSEIEKTDRLLRQLGVEQEIHFRPPFGFKLLFLPYILAKMHKKNILWNVDPKDFAASEAKVIESYVLDHVKPGSIILLHDGGGDRSLTIAATESLIQQLQAKGYQFKTVSELLALKN
jgi:peptidoglycan/xylan/chitin deacetylase (PgdA/CDA1 family)